MNLKKIITGLFLLLFLNGCVQGTALLGPAYTLTSTGNIYHAGLSYGSSKAINKITGKTTTENIKSFVENKKIKAQDQVSDNEFFVSLQNKIEKKSKIIDLANQ
jgi:hypothetical protein